MKVRWPNVCFKPDKNGKEKHYYNIIADWERHLI